MSNPRIITGSAKGQRLEVPEKGTRPMSDRVKSALFSMIQTLIPKATILDLYAGTGALGIECLSRGAKNAVFVDRAKDAIDCIYKNLKKTGMESLGNVIKSSVNRFIDEYDKFDLEEEKYDIIFFTPPYTNFREKLIPQTEKVLKKDGILIVEHPENRDLSDRVGDLEKIDSRKYGITGLSFFRLTNK